MPLVVWTISNQSSLCYDVVLSLSSTNGERDLFPSHFCTYDCVSLECHVHVLESSVADVQMHLYDFVGFFLLLLLLLLVINVVRLWYNHTLQCQRHIELDRII